MRHKNFCVSSSSSALCHAQTTTTLILKLGGLERSGQTLIFSNSKPTKKEEKSVQQKNLQLFRLEKKNIYPLLFFCNYVRLSKNLIFIYFHQLGPSGPSWSQSCHVGLSVCLSVCLFGPSGAVFLGLSSALRSLDQVPASHWSTHPPPP